VFFLFPGRPGRFLELLCLAMLYLIAKPSHIGVDVDGQAFSLDRPMVCSRQRGSQSFLTCVAPSCHAAVGDAIFPWDAKPSGLDILCGVECPVTCKRH
jgi:hypothetical protein